ncbi:unnamed protein product, partial [Porites lobata]
LVNLKVKYVTSLIQNINKRFSKCQDIFSAFKVFHSELIPRREHQQFKNDGEADVMLLAKHCASSDVDQFLAEWHRFKYDLIDFQGADNRIQQATKVKIIPCLTFPLA